MERHVLADLLRQGGEELILSFQREGDVINAVPDAERDSVCGEKRGPDALRDEKTTCEKKKGPDALQDEKPARKEG